MQEFTNVTIKDYTKEYGLSSTGKSKTVASTKGNVQVDGADGLVVGLNAYRKAYSSSGAGYIPLARGEVEVGTNFCFETKKGWDMMNTGRHKREIDPNETPTTEYALYVLLALVALGGSARDEPILEYTEFLMRRVLQPEDYALVHWAESGLSDFAPKGTDKAWPVWASRVRIVLMRWSIGMVIGKNVHYSPEEVPMKRHKGVHTITSAGIILLASLAAKQLGDETV